MIPCFAQEWNVINLNPTLTSMGDYAGASELSEAFCVEDAQQIVIILATGHNAAGGNATITVEACTDASDTGNTAIAFWVTKYETVVGTGTTSNNDIPSATCAAVASTGFTTVKTADAYYVIEVDPAAVSALGVTYKYVQVMVTEVTNQVVGGSLIALVKPRYKGDPLLSRLV